MRKFVMFAAASIAAIIASTNAQAATAIGDTFAIGSFSGQDCPITGGGGGGFSNCWATQTGVVAGQPANNPTASQVVAAIAGNPGTTTDINSAAYPTISGSEFTVTVDGSNTLLFTYLMGSGDPTLHYISIKQADGYELFYNAGSFASGTTYSFNLSSYFPGTPGYSHITVYDEAGPVPEPATWAMMLLGFGGIGMAMRRRRKPSLLQIA